MISSSDNLVAVGDASERLEEDPLRILRAVRFASRYGLEIDEELGAAIETNLPQLLTLSPERIRRELDTILKSRRSLRPVRDRNFRDYHSRI